MHLSSLKFRTLFCNSWTVIHTKQPPVLFSIFIVWNNNNPLSTTVTMWSLHSDIISSKSFLAYIFLQLKCSLWHPLAQFDVFYVTSSNLCYLFFACYFKTFYCFASLVMIIREPREERRRGGGSKCTFRRYKFLHLLEKKKHLKLIFTNQWKFLLDPSLLNLFLMGSTILGQSNVWSRFGIFFLEVSHFRIILWQLF